MLNKLFENLTQILYNYNLNIIINNKYIYSLFILISTIILASLLIFIVKNIIKKITNKTKTKLDDNLLEIIQKPLLYIIILFGILFGIFPLSLSEEVNYIISNIIFSFIIGILIVILIKIINQFLTNWSKILTKKAKSDIDEDLLPFLHKFSKIILFIFGFLLILKLWGVNITGLLAGLGIAGIAIGFAVKDSLANIFGGISLILDKTIKVGDRIKLDSGELGEVEEVGLRSTKLRTFDNDLLIIPNGNLSNQKIQNYTLPNSKLRVKIFFGVVYGSNIDKVKKVVINAVKNLKNVSKENKPSVLFMEMSDFSLNFRCDIWVDHYKDAFMTKIEANKAIYNALNKANINIPFPTRTIYNKKA